MLKPSFYQQSFEDIENKLLQSSLHPSAASRLFHWHYRQKKFTPCLKDVAQNTQEFVASEYDFSLPEIEIAHQSSDQTVKFLFKLKDGMKVESVLIPFQNKYTLCLSTQVGCGMKCSFCFTGTQGLKRNLATEEIVGQFLGAWRWMEENRPDDHKILNIVYMGQGEPLHNFDAVKKANQIFLTKKGTDLSSLKITVSTAGYLPGLLRWKEEMPAVNVALSLHSAFDEKRSQIIPINQRYPLNQILEVLDQIPLKKKQYITYEYLVLKDFNDSLEDAHATAELLKERKALVNLIPFNPYPGAIFERPDMARVISFQEILERSGIPTTIRTTKGDDILAACGQLNTILRN